MMRFGTEQDARAVRALFDLCFPDESGFNDYFFRHVFRMNDVLLYETEGQLSAMLQRMPQTLILDGAQLPVTYIYGACTHPALRRQSLMAQLLEYSHTLDKQQGIQASVLIPQEAWLYDFYARFGYKTAFYKAQAVWQDTGEDAEMPRALTQDDLPQVDFLYTQAASNCHIARNLQMWHTQLQMFHYIGCGAYGFWSGDALTGYAFCWADTVQEAVGLTAAQKNGILRQLGQASVKIEQCGEGVPTGCIRWHNASISMKGYMNLLFN